MAGGKEPAEVDKCSYCRFSSSPQQTQSGIVYRCYLQASKCIPSWAMEEILEELRSAETRQTSPSDEPASKA